MGYTANDIQVTQTSQDNIRVGVDISGKPISDVEKMQSVVQELQSEGLDLTQVKIS